MSKILTFVFSLLFTGNLFAVGLTYVIPDESKLVPVKHKYLPSVIFRGEVDVSGAFEIGYVENPNTNYFRLNFYPDQEVVGRLPYISGHEPIRIEIRNPDELISQLVTSELKNQLVLGEINALIGKVVFTLDSFVASSVCDHTGYEANVISIREIRDLQIAGNKVKAYGC